MGPPFGIDEQAAGLEKAQGGDEHVRPFHDGGGDVVHRHQHFQFFQGRFQPFPVREAFKQIGLGDDQRLHLSAFHRSQNRFPRGKVRVDQPRAECVGTGEQKGNPGMFAGGAKKANRLARNGREIGTGQIRAAENGGAPAVFQGVGDGRNSRLNRFRQVRRFGQGRVGRKVNGGLEQGRHGRAGHFGQNRQVMKIEGQLHGARVDHRNSRAGSNRLSQGHGGHGRFGQRVRADDQGEIDLLQLAEGKRRVRGPRGQRVLDGRRFRRRREQGRSFPSLVPNGRRERGQGIHPGTGGTDDGDRLRLGSGQAIRRGPDGFRRGGPFAVHQAHPGTIRPVGVAVSVPAPVADEMAVDVGGVGRFHPDHFPIPGQRRGVAAQAAVDAEGRGSLEIPAPAFVAGGLVGIDSGGADVDDVSREGAFQRAGFLAAEIDAIGDAGDAQILVAAEFLVIAGTPVALDAPVHLVGDQRAEILIDVGPFGAFVAADGMVARDGQVLEQAVAALVADRAVVGMVEHEPFDDVAAEIDGFGIDGGNHHVVLGVDHARHLDALDRTFQQFHGADPTGPHRAQGRVVTETGNHDAELFGGVDDLGPLGDFDFLIVNYELRHIVSHGPS